MVTLKTGGSAPYVDEGWYKATLIEREEKESQNPQYPAPQVIWHFTLEDDNGTIMTDDRGSTLDFWVFTSLAAGPKSNARPMVEALTGHSFQAGDEEDEAVVGNTCQVKIADYFREDGEFGGSKAVKGSWLALGAPRPGAAQRPTRAPAAAASPAT